MQYCTRCGRANASQAMFCTGCGASLAMPQRPDQTPPPPPYGVAASMPQYQPSVEDSSPPVKDVSSPWLWLNVASLVLCCPGSLPFNVIGLLLAASAGKSYKSGDYAGNIRKAKTARVMFITGLVFGVIGIAIAGILGYKRVFG